MTGKAKGSEIVSTCKQEKMLAPSADMICSCPPSCRASQAFLCLTVVRSGLQAAPELSELDLLPVSKHDARML